MTIAHEAYQGVVVERLDDVQRIGGLACLDHQVIARLRAELGNRVMRHVHSFHPSNLTTETRLGGAARRSRMDPER